MFVLQGADDGLVKMWSLNRYFLLATLRGHKKEISDLSVNSRNTMLASGSCDKVHILRNIPYAAVFFNANYHVVSSSV